MADELQVVLICQDINKTELSRRTVGKSTIDKCKFIVDMIKGQTDSDNENLEIPLTVKPEVLDKLIEFLEHHVNNPIVIIDKPMNKPFADQLDEWTKNYFNQSDEQFDDFVELLEAANLLEQTELLEICCARIADINRTKSIDELMELYKIEQMQTPEELEKKKQEFIDQNIVAKTKGLVKFDENDKKKD